MAIEYTNRRSQTYYLHVGKTKLGKPKYHFSQKSEGTLADSIPEGFEIYENPNAQVFLRKLRPQLISETEFATVEDGVRHWSAVRHFLVDVQKTDIIVYTAENNPFENERILSIMEIALSPALEAMGEKLLQYTPMMKFTLIDDEERCFRVQRWCFKGSVDGWITLLAGTGDLNSMVERYCCHLGRESFYELI